MGQSMDETTRWILGIMGFWNFIMSGAILKLLLGQARMEGAQSIKGRQAARQLHSPDNHLGIDILLDKYILKTASKEELQELYIWVESIQANPSCTDIERMLARTIFVDLRFKGYK